MADVKVSSLFLIRGQSCGAYKKPDWTDNKTGITKPGGWVFQLQAKVSLSNGEFREQIQDVGLGQLAPELIKPWKDSVGKSVEVCVTVKGGQKEAVYVNALQGSVPVVVAAGKV